MLTDTIPLQDKNATSAISPSTPLEKSLKLQYRNLLRCVNALHGLSSSQYRYVTLLTSLLKIPVIRVTLIILSTLLLQSRYPFHREKATEINATRRLERTVTKRCD